MNLNEFNQFVEELATKQIVDSSKANKSFELEDTSNNDLKIEQPVEPSTSKKSISWGLSPSFSRKFLIEEGPEKVTFS